MQIWLYLYLQIYCRPECDEEYQLPRWATSLTCEDGSWVTDNYPYNDASVCFPKGKQVKQIEKTGIFTVGFQFNPCPAEPGYVLPFQTV